MSLPPTLVEYLSRHGTRYTLEHHMHSLGSLESAREVGVDEESLARSVVLGDERRFVLAVIPASRRLELERGAVPPIGAACGLPTVIDGSLEELDDAIVADIASENTTLLAALATRERLKARLVAVSSANGSPAGSGRIWLQRMRRELASLSSALEGHMEEAERTGGAFDEILEVAPRGAHEVERLMVENAALLAECARLGASRLFGRFEAQRSRGADLVFDAFGVDIGGG
jgi:Ala-tRNA(Pro) deacylase